MSGTSDYLPNSTAVDRNQTQPYASSQPFYDAFISYSHAADGTLAPMLQRALERYAIPWYRRPTLRIFRDETNLSVTPHAWPTIQTNLDRARFLILMASPEASASKWVRKELTHWLTTKSPETLLIVLTAGTITWDDVRRDFDWDRTTALPDILRGKFQDEPLHVDLRNWGKTPGELTLRNDHFADKVLRLAAPLHGKPMDELSVQAAREVTRRIRHARIAVALIIALAIAASGAAAGFLNQWNETLTSLAQSTSHELAARARLEIGDRADLAVVLAKRSIEVARARNVPSTVGASALRDTMAETRGTRAFCLQDGEGRSIDIFEPKRLVAVATSAGAVCLFRRGDNDSLRLVDTLQSFGGGSVEEARFSADGQWLITHLWGGPLRALPVGRLYQDSSLVQRGQANYEFGRFGQTDTAKALSFDRARARVAFFSSATRRIEIWHLLKFDPNQGPLISLDPHGHTLATAFDPTGAYLAALVIDGDGKQATESAWQFWQPDEHDFRARPRFFVKIWSLATLAATAMFEVMENRSNIYLGDGIAMGALRGSLQLSTEARWAIPAMFLADSHSLEPRKIAQVIRVADGKVVANFMHGEGGKSFDD
jgi:hypothetical protein